MKKVILTIVTIVLIGIPLFLTMRSQMKIKEFFNRRSSNNISEESVPPCQGSEHFTASPIDLYSDSSITPLGNLNPIAGHVTPTDHIYLNSHLFQGSRTDYIGPQFTLRSPGDITLLGIQKSEHTLFGQITKDYRLTFSLCRDLEFFFDHVQNLSPAIQTILDNKSSLGNCGNDQQGATSQKMCNYVVSSPLKAGEEIGKVGISFDFGGYDLRTQSLPFINKERTITGPFQYFHTICPLDYFSQNVKTSLYEKVKNTVKNARGFPDCGTTIQDKLGTIQGNWYLNGSVFQNGLQRFDTELAIVHSNTDPHLGVISVGGTITQAGETEFVPADSGSVNREPSQVSADGKIYCYQDRFGQGHFNIQLINATTLQIEYLSGACTTVSVFTHPFIYNR